MNPLITKERNHSVFKAITRISVCLWQLSVTLPEWVSGGDVGLAVLPGYTTVTGADLSAV